jgi:hypothetical protein
MDDTHEQACSGIDLDDRSQFFSTVHTSLSLTAICRGHPSGTMSA